jgi:2-amino-4-hydroxy-6-hydroxymethyldihydropteridine diphosphokinase
MLFGHFIGIGSNIGAELHVGQAIRGLLAVSQELTLSRVLTTQPMGMGIASRSPFLNAVAYLRNDSSAQELKKHLNMIEGQLGRDRSDPERGRKDRTIDLDVLLSLRPGWAEIRGEQVPVETYYRPQMLELIHALGFDCCISADIAGDAVEIEFEGCRVGSRPVQIGCRGGLMRAATSCRK